MKHEAQIVGELQIRKAEEADADRVAEIYNKYVTHTIFTFETAPIVPSDMARRIRDVLARHDWLIGELEGRIVGYAYYAPFRPRAAYSKTAESTIYLSEEGKGKGFGRKLYSALIQSAAEHGIRQLIGVIALPNPASVALHAKFGFYEAGILQGVGYKFGQFHDIALWQRAVGEP